MLRGSDNYDPKYKRTSALHQLTNFILLKNSSSFWVCVIALWVMSFIGVLYEITMLPHRDLEPHWLHYVLQHNPTIAVQPSTGYVDSLLVLNNSGTSIPAQIPFPAQPSSVSTFLRGEQSSSTTTVVDEASKYSEAGKLLWFAKILVGLASYRDEECHKTIWNSMQMAANPDRIYFGIIEQHNFSVGAEHGCLFLLEQQCSEAGDEIGKVNPNSFFCSNNEDFT